ncbi:ABC transporter ATP-binding protein [Mycoplasma sp. 2045]|uniref:ABC transporter ATP-binding protein n=1 Tax=Mycoplasma sp. 2045 TaxID=2967301 RepID=UPI00211B90B6|nr:ABC transporter ATP-binding protein [Mycoplasma sp. 2045]UUM20193.1 ABC transporter ATP-binding protein [Mycoplasma sp. 2045]
MNNTSIKVQNLTKIYNHNSNEKKGVFDLSFEVPKGSFHAFIGENGSGKTTTIKSIIGSYTNFSGQIYINGIINSDPKSKAKLGYVPENAIFPKELNVFEYLYIVSLFGNKDKQQLKDKINNFLEKFEISDLKKNKPNNLSSGQKKKVLLIQALLNNPDLIILDEPAANLDPTARFKLFEILSELNKQGKTIIISSHILSEIDKYATSYTLIHKGKLVSTGQKHKSLEDIYYEKIIQN